jgi:hypothetical protein
MKKLLVLLALLPAAPALADASTTVPPVFAAPSVGPAVDASNLPQGPALPITCESRFDALMSDLQSGKAISGANVSLLVGDQALAESPLLPSPGQGFNPIGGNAVRSGNKINGTSKVATPGNNMTSAPLTYVISKVDGKARLSWTYKGKNYASNIDSCSSGYWTSATSGSAIIVKLGPVQNPPQ